MSKVGGRGRERIRPKHDENPPALRPESIPHRDFNIVESDECCSSSRRLEIIGVRTQHGKDGRPDVHSLS